MRVFFFFFNAPPTTEIYTLSLHDALPISDVERHGEDAAGDRRKRHRLPAALLGAAQCREQRLPELVFLIALAETRTDGVDHALERQLSRGGDHRAARRDRAAAADDAIGLLLQRRSRGARNDSGDAAAVRELAVGGVDDGLDCLFQQVAADDLEDSARRYFFPEERFLRWGTLLLDLRLCPELPHQPFDLALHQLLLDARPHLGEGRKLHLPHVVELDDMEAKARAHRRLRVLAFLELHHDVGELRVEHARHVPVEVAAAVLGAVVLRVLGRQLVELAALLQLGDHALRLVLGLEHDVARLYSLSPVWAFARSYSFCTSSSVI